MGVSAGAKDVGTGSMKRLGIITLGHLLQTEVADIRL